MEFSDVLSHMLAGSCEGEDDEQKLAVLSMDDADRQSPFISYCQSLNCNVSPHQV